LVAHLVDNTRRHAITMFVRGPDLAPGEIGLEPALVGEVDGEIVDLVALDHDAAAVTTGRVSVFLNRSPGDGPGSN
jgi:hypothetical protein